MNVNEIMKILEEEGIKKEDLRESRYEDASSYTSKLNKKGGHLVLSTYVDEPKRSNDFCFELEKQDFKFRSGWFSLVIVYYEKGKLIGVDMGIELEEDKVLFSELKKPTTKEEEVEFIRKVIKVYKEDL